MISLKQDQNGMKTDVFRMKMNVRKAQSTFGRIKQNQLTQDRELGNGGIALCKRTGA